MIREEPVPVHGLQESGCSRISSRGFLRSRVISEGNHSTIPSDAGCPQAAKLVKRRAMKPMARTGPHVSTVVRAVSGTKILPLIIEHRPVDVIDRVGRLFASHPLPDDSVFFEEFRKFGAFRLIDSRIRMKPDIAVLRLTDDVVLVSSTVPGSSSLSPCQDACFLIVIEKASKQRLRWSGFDRGHSSFLHMEN